MDQPAQYMVPPARFEAGTQPVAQVVAAGVAAEWMMNVGLENIEAHERTIAAELLKMGDIDGVRILGPSAITAPSRCTATSVCMRRTAHPPACTTASTTLTPWSRPWRRFVRSSDCDTCRVYAVRV